MAIDPVEATFRARMRALARKGGAVTRRLYADDPGRYREIGRLGGNASVAARKARIAVELEDIKPGEAPIVESGAQTTEVTPVLARPPLTLSQVLASLGSTKAGAPKAGSRHDSLTDLQAEKDFAPFIARPDASDDDEPWDPWSKHQ
jgi:hypothetical protein